MRHITIPADHEQSKQFVLDRLRSRCDPDGIAFVRILVGADKGNLWAQCGRVDLARPGARGRPTSRPLGELELIIADLPISEFLKKLVPAFSGDPFEVDGRAILGHGLDNAWNGIHFTDQWEKLRVEWPVFYWFPSSGKQTLVRPYEAIEATGELGAFDGYHDCARHALQLETEGMRDAALSRIQLLEWDYRGAIRQLRSDDEFSLAIEPTNDGALSLALVAHDSRGALKITVASPGVVEPAFDSTTTRISATLRHSGEIVSEFRWDLLDELSVAAHDGSQPRSLFPGSRQDALAKPQQSSSIIAEQLFAFASNTGLAAMLARDLEEFELVVRTGANKAVALLAGSILEATLLDVLGRNAGHAFRLLGKKWPEKASLTDLIEAAMKTVVLLPDGSETALLPPLTGRKGAVIVDHRDLIHPRAEIRASATIDAHTSQTMAGLLGEVVRDLRKAHETGVLKEYEAGRIAQA